MSVFAAMAGPAAHNELPERPIDAHRVNNAPTSHAQVTGTARNYMCLPVI